MPQWIETEGAVKQIVRIVEKECGVKVKLTVQDQIGLVVDEAITDAQEDRLDDDGPSCQQGAPCADPTKCPDPAGCGHVGKAEA